MSVYFLKAQGLIKIGYSANVMRRVESVLSPFAEGGEVLGIIPGDRALEAFMHQKFAAFRTHGEWFTPAEDILRFIAMLDAPSAVEQDKEDDRTLIQMYEDKYIEDCADCLHALRRGLREDEREDCLPSVARWCGIPLKRLQKIYAGEVEHVTGAEYTVCRALGEAAGFKPSMIMDGLKKFGAYPGARPPTE
jgi:hypothetical protein